MNIFTAKQGVAFAFLYAILYNILFCSALFAWQLEPQPVVKNGPCPTDYYSQGSYCLPNKNANFAIDKVGNCPPGYHSSGYYCVANSNAKYIMIKYAKCPEGFYSYGDYCISKK